MRSLPEIVQDWRDAAAILQEQADQLEELARFFGAAAGPAASPKKTAPEPYVQPPVHFDRSPEQQPEPEKPRRGRPAGAAGRKLSLDEKRLIREDYEKIPPALRTRTNRAALAAKWNCSPIQIFALGRDQAELASRLQKGKSAANDPGQ